MRTSPRPLPRLSVRASLRVSVRLLPLLLGALALPAAAWQVDGGTPTAPATHEVAAPDSPRSQLTQFNAFTARQDWAGAARFLELPRGTPPEEGPELARELSAVLDRHVGRSTEALSGESEGAREDGLPPDVEQVGSVPGPEGKVSTPVRLVRRQTSEGPRWLFSANTVANVHRWYGALEHRWLREHLPAFLLRPGPRDVQGWQWVALLGLALLAWGVGRLLGRLTQGLLGRLAARTATRWDDVVLESLARPLTGAWALLLLSLAQPLLALSPHAGAFVQQLLKVAAFVLFFWGLMRLLDATGQLIVASPWAGTRPATRSLVPLGRRSAKALLGAIAVVAVMSELGYPVASLVAGLGIGGLAVALAAQKTVENLFGAFSLGVDQPIREGDYVKVEDIAGTVESIGLRSTRIRTLERTLVTIPNGKLAEMRLETFAVRDRLRLSTALGLSYDTSAAQMRAVLAGLQAVLEAHPLLWPEGHSVRFTQLTETALTVEVNAWFKLTDWGEFTRLRQELFLQFLEVVERAGTSFAFPRRAVYLRDERPRP